MSEEKRQTDFATRLKRIEKTRQNPEATPPEMVQRSAKPSPYDIPQENYFVRNSLIWLVLAAAVATGGFFAIKAIPQELKDTIAWMTGNDDPAEDATPSDTSDVAESDGISD
jgi:hypothetical protein